MATMYDKEGNEVKVMKGQVAQMEKAGLTFEAPKAEKESDKKEPAKKDSK